MFIPSIHSLSVTAYPVQGCGVSGADPSSIFLFHRRLLSTPFYSKLSTVGTNIHRDQSYSVFYYLKPHYKDCFYCVYSFWCTTSGRTRLISEWWHSSDLLSISSFHTTCTVPLKMSASGSARCSNTPTDNICMTFFSNWCQLSWNTTCWVRVRVMVRVRGLDSPTTAF